ncbi:MAG: CinA family protein [Alphaproteobacteria bacterium]|nr:CinA family protein [Alphaproteobacteria bacterium]
MRDLEEMGAAAGALLKERGERIAIAESSSGGLISAALLAVPGASIYYAGGGIIYTGRALKGLLGLSRTDIGVRGLRSSSEPYAAFLAETVRAKHRVDWGLAETGAAGPTGNPYGDPAGHTCLAIAGPKSETLTLRTGSADRSENMWLFAEAALELLVSTLETAPRQPRPPG